MEPGVVRKYIGGIYHGGALKSSASGHVALLQEQSIIVMTGNGRDEVEGRLTFAQLSEGWFTGLKEEEGGIHRSRISRPPAMNHTDAGSKTAKLYGLKSEVPYEENRTASFSGVEWSLSSGHGLENSSHTLDGTNMTQEEAHEPASKKRKTKQKETVPLSTAAPTQHEKGESNECMAIKAYFSTHAVPATPPEEAGREAMVIVVPWWLREQLSPANTGEDASTNGGGEAMAVDREEGDANEGRKIKNGAGGAAPTPNILHPSYIYISPSRTYGQEIKKVIWLGEVPLYFDASQTLCHFSQILAIIVDSEIQLWSIYYTSQVSGEDAPEGQELVTGHSQFLLSFSPHPEQSVTCIHRLEASSALEGAPAGFKSFALATSSEGGFISIWRLSIPLNAISTYPLDASQVEIHDIWRTMLPELRQSGATEICEVPLSAFTPSLHTPTGPSSTCLPRLLIASNGILCFVDPNAGGEASGGASTSKASSSGRSSHNPATSSNRMDEDGAPVAKTGLLASIYAHSMLISNLQLLPPFSLPKSLWDAQHRSYLTRLAKGDSIEAKSTNPTPAKPGKGAKTSNLPTSRPAPSSTASMDATQGDIDTFGVDVDAFGCITSSLDGVARVWLFSSLSSSSSSGSSSTSSAITTKNRGGPLGSRDEELTSPEKTWQIELKWEGTLSTMTEESAAIHRGEGIYGPSAGDQPPQTPSKSKSANAMDESTGETSDVIDSESKLLAKCIVPPSAVTMVQLASQLNAKDASAICSLLGLNLSPNGLYARILASTAPRTTPTPFSALGIVRIPFTTLVAACRNSLLLNLPSQASEASVTSNTWNPCHWDLLLATRTLPPTLLVRLVEAIQADTFLSELCTIAHYNTDSSIYQLLHTRSTSLAQVMVAHWMSQNYPNWLPKSSTASSSSATIHSSSSSDSVNDIGRLLSSLRAQCLLNHIKASLKRLSHLHTASSSGGSSTAQSSSTSSSKSTPTTGSRKKGTEGETTDQFVPASLSRLDCFTLAHFAVLLYSMSKGECEGFASDVREACLEQAKTVLSLLNDGLALQAPRAGHGRGGGASSSSSSGRGASASAKKVAFGEMADLVASKARALGATSASASGSTSKHGASPLDAIIGRVEEVGEAKDEAGGVIFACPYCQEASSTSSTIVSVQTLLDAAYNPSSTSAAIPRQLCPHDELPLQSCLSTGLLLSSPSMASECPHCSVLVFNPVKGSSSSSSSWLAAPTWTQTQAKGASNSDAICSQSYCPLCQVCLSPSSSR